jgi:nicotinate-nucleotide adenylyltransferase
MRLGIYGGTFDPVHYGHLLLAEQCREACGLDEIWLVPAGDPPHKQGHAISPAKSRREMLEMAVAGLPQFRVSTIEIDRPGPHYTVETLREIRRTRPGDELFLLMGRDSLLELSTWREPDQIAELATIVAVNRGRETIAMNLVRESLGEVIANRVQVVSMPGVDLSASDLRERVRTGRSIRFQVPRAVEQYIVEHALYRGDAGAGSSS